MKPLGLELVHDECELIKTHHITIVDVSISKYVSARPAAQIRPSCKQTKTFFFFLNYIYVD